MWLGDGGIGSGGVGDNVATAFSQSSPLLLFTWFEFNLILVWRDAYE